MPRRDETSPYAVPLLCWAVLAAAFWFALASYVSWLWFVDVLLALNASTFCVYGLDKLLALTSARRVPERVLWFTAFFGAPVGALLAMNVFRHKTSKTSFQFGLAVALFIEVLVVGAALWQFGLLPMPS